MTNETKPPKFKVELRNQICSTRKTPYILVCQVWEGVDRPYTGGYSAGNNRALALRLKKAMEDGVAFPFKEICTDINGDTYVNTHYNVNCRIMNASLRRLGY